MRFKSESLNDLTTLCRSCHEKFHGVCKSSKVGVDREANRAAIWRVVSTFKDGKNYATKVIAKRSGVEIPNDILNDLVEEGRLVRISKRLWRKPYELSVAKPLSAEKRFRQLPGQLGASAKKRREPAEKRYGQPSPLDEFSLRAEQDRKTRSTSGRASTGST